MCDEFEETLVETDGAGNCKKTNKPLMEKRRRARINKCLHELKSILKTDASSKVAAGHSKWEKADILEMAVQYVHTLREQHSQQPKKTDPLSFGQFLAGYSECTRQVQQYFDKTPTISDNSISTGLVSHLLGYLNALTKNNDDVTSALNVKIEENDANLNQKPEKSRKRPILISTGSSISTKFSRSSDSESSITISPSHSATTSTTDGEMQSPQSPFSPISATPMTEWKKEEQAPHPCNRPPPAHAASVIRSPDTPPQPRNYLGLLTAAASLTNNADDSMNLKCENQNQTLSQDDQSIFNFDHRLLQLAAVAAAARQSNELLPPAHWFSAALAASTVWRPWP